MYSNSLDDEVDWLTYVVEDLSFEVRYVSQALMLLDTPAYNDSELQSKTLRNAVNDLRNLARDAELVFKEFKEARID